MASISTFEQQHIIEEEIQQLLKNLGEGRVEGVAYDTAWVARLVNRYPGNGFEECLTWLRHNQYDDGTWGAPLVHYHDRFISTLAAIVALREVGDAQDERRVQRGEDALWRYISKISNDDSDTVGFPILAASLAEEAKQLGLEVPIPPVRYSEKYYAKVKALLTHSNRDWLSNAIVVSSEALRSALTANDTLISDNFSVGMSPAATASYLLKYDNQDAVNYLKKLKSRNGSNMLPAFNPIDMFEIAWVLNQLRLANAISPTDPQVKPFLDFLWENWSPVDGTSYSQYSNVRDLDDTTVCFSVLHWAGYPVSPDVFKFYEREKYFCCYPNETNPSMSVQVRLLVTLQPFCDDPLCAVWIDKIINALYRLDENGSFWFDKWHSSPYYINSIALNCLPQFAEDLACSRFKWILRTQNDDGGWGYYGQSTMEETAYCLKALTLWDAQFNDVNPSVLFRASQYIVSNLHDDYYPPLWLGKTLYTPYYVARATVQSALYAYYNSSHMC